MIKGQEKIVDDLLDTVESAGLVACELGLPVPDMMYSLFAHAVLAYVDSGVPLVQIQEQVTAIYDARKAGGS